MSGILDSKEITTPKSSKDLVKELKERQQTGGALDVDFLLYALRSFLYWASKNAYPVEYLFLKDPRILVSGEINKEAKVAIAYENNLVQIIREL